MTAIPEMPVGVRDAAAALGLSPSTVSRYLSAHPDLVVGEGKRPKVFVSQLRRHRGENVNESMAGNYAGQLIGDADPVEDIPAPRDHERRVLVDPTYRTAKTAREAIMAKTAQLELEKKLGQVVSRRLVEDAAAEAGMALRDGLVARAKDLADLVAVMSDPREIRAEIETADRKILERIADAFLRKLGGDDTV